MQEPELYFVIPTYRLRDKKKESSYALDSLEIIEVLSPQT